MIYLGNTDLFVKSECEFTKTIEMPFIENDSVIYGLGIRADSGAYQRA